MPTLVLLRHGQSTWNLENLFTGWHDVDLTPKGEAEAADAGRFMSAAGVLPDVLHTSLQKRAIRTANLALEAMDRLWIPVRRHWRLNERHYGKLQGLDKKATRDQYGDAQFQQWRRSYDVPPPAVDRDSPHHPANDPRYAGLPPDVLPVGECLKDVLLRVVPYWHDVIVPDLRSDKVVLVAAHGNSLRALKKHLEGVSDEDIAAVNIPTGFPLVYDLGDDLVPKSVSYLPDDDTAAAAAAAVAKQGH